MVKMLIYPEILPKFLLMGLLELLLRSYHTWSNMLETNEHVQNITLNVSHTFIAHIHTRTHTHMDTYTHGRIHTRTHTHACTTHTQSHIHAHTCTHNAAVMWKYKHFLLNIPYPHGHLQCISKLRNRVSLQERNVYTLWPVWFLIIKPARYVYAQIKTHTPTQELKNSRWGN